MANCTSTTGPDFPSPNTENGQACVVNPTTGVSCPAPSADKTCNPFQLSKGRDSCLIDNLVNESLNIGGADFNIFKLLGVHEQCKTVDSIGYGLAISGGSSIGYPEANAFDEFITEWHSLQQGNGVIASSYIGYDFGTIKTNDQSRDRYGIDASVQKHITAIAIKQSPASKNRVVKARIERSEDGRKWYGAAIIELPDDDCLNTILFRDSVTSRYWRIRPTEFNGGASDYWGVQALQMFHNYVATDISNIQDKIFLENRDRDYADESILLKGYYDFNDFQSELSRFGIELPSQSIYMSVNFSACVAKLGRPLIIGDIVEIPSEAQYSAKMEKIQKWLEVTDVAWSTEGYTPGWQPTMLRVILQPAFASQETQDIFGDLAEQELPDELGLMDKGDGNHPLYQDYSDVSQEIQAQSKELVPEDGRETSSTIRAWEEEEIQSAAEQGVPHLQRIGQNNVGLYTEDAMPPNNAPYSEGPDYPTSPTHGEYHRMTYEGLSKDVPARLFRYSDSKGRWVFLEKDRRAEFDGNKPRLQEFLEADGATSNTEIMRKKTPHCEEE